MDSRSILLVVTSGGYASAPETYSYDPEGNRTASHLSASYTTGPANRLIEDDDACYAYDANGNLETRTAKTGVSCTGAVTAYSWDVLNRLTAIDFADGTSATYRYDAQGRRIEKAVNGALTRYVYDDDAILLEYDGGDVLQARYAHGEEIDQPLSMARGGASYFYQVDHLGSIRLITDAAGAIVSRYDYDAFGNLEATSFEGVASPYGFTARERDAESGLMFYRARYYDPKVGRFISEDPIGFEGEDLNVYRYVFNGPLIAIDPNGMSLFSFYVTSAELRLAIIWPLLSRMITAIIKKALDKARDALIAGIGVAVGSEALGHGANAMTPFSPEATCLASAATAGGASGAAVATAAWGPDTASKAKSAGLGALTTGLVGLYTHIQCMTEYNTLLMDKRRQEFLDSLPD